MIVVLMNSSGTNDLPSKTRAAKTTMLLNHWCGRMVLTNPRQFERLTTAVVSGSWGDSVVGIDMRRSYYERISSRSSS